MAKKMTPPAPAMPAWFAAVKAAGEGKANGASLIGAAIDAIREAGGLAAGAARVGALAEVDAAYLTGYVSRLPETVATYIKLDKKAFKDLNGDAKDADTEKGRAAIARKNASSAVYEFRKKIEAEFPVATEGEGEGEGEGEVSEADKAKRIEEARKAYSKAAERAEAQLKKARQALADLGAEVIDEARITAGFLPIRGPFGGEPEKA